MASSLILTVIHGKCMATVSVSQEFEKSEGMPGTHCLDMCGSQVFLGNLETIVYVSVLLDCISLDD